MRKVPPSEQIDELKAMLYLYIVLGPLVAALFANHIDNVFAACFLFVCLVGAAFYWIRSRMEALEQSVREQEERLEELSQLLESERHDRGEFYRGKDPF